MYVYNIKQYQSVANIKLGLYENTFNMLEISNYAQPTTKIHNLTEDDIAIYEILLKDIKYDFFISPRLNNIGLASVNTVVNNYLTPEQNVKLKEAYEDLLKKSMLNYQIQQWSPGLKVRPALEDDQIKLIALISYTLSDSAKINIRQ